MAVFADTVTDMITDFGYMVGEPDINNSRWGRAARLRFLNLAQLNAVNKTRCLEEEWSSTVTAFSSAGDEIFALPPNLYDDGIIEIYWKDSSGDYHPLSEFHPRFKNIQNDDTGTPSQFFRIGGNIHLMPKQDAAGTIIIIGQKMPDELVNNNDTSLIPESYRHVCPLGATKMAFREDDEYGKSDRTDMEFRDVMRDLRKYANKMRSVRTPRMRLPHSL